MRFTVLSHAGLAVERGETQLLVDPWIVGSCYWRSWWNLPEPPGGLIEGLRPTHIHLTHLHWDHFHGPSLRRFDRNTPILVPRFNNDRMKRDLGHLGFHDVRELEHGAQVVLGDDLVLHSYQFLNDSAAVISDGDTTLFDANDCKVFGLPLRQILVDHPSIDFVLRSHSNASAYPYCVEDYETVCPEVRPRQAYMDEFADFAGAVDATYAVPFASNHCFLHPETRRYNELAVRPTEVKARFDERAADDPRLGTCVIMNPGSSWSGGTFDLVDFDDEEADAAIAEMAERHGPKIEAQRAEEHDADFDLEVFSSYMQRLSAAVPRPLRRSLGVIEFRVVEHGRERPIRIDVRTGEVEDRPAEDPTFSIRCQALILNDCARWDMFSVWTPSKRLSVRVRDRRAVDRLLLFFSLLDALELGYLPLRANLSGRMFGSSRRRWREAAELGRTAVRTKVFRRPFDPWPAS